jgi:hypothetical protein
MVSHSSLFSALCQELRNQINEAKVKMLRVSERQGHMTSTDKQSSRLHLPRRSFLSLIPCLPTRVVNPVQPIMATAEGPARVHGKCKSSCSVEVLLTGVPYRPKCTSSPILELDEAPGEPQKLFRFDIKPLV